MNILVINGSPKGKRSNTYRMTQAFVEGMQQAVEDVQVDELTVRQLEIKACLGCFACWNKTPGKCCIQDDMQMVIQKRLWADVTIWSFPLYYFNVPGGLKSLIDRQLPMVLPFMTEREDQVGNGSHPMRYDMSGKQNVVISTCGFYTAEGNYDSVLSMFDHICGKDQYTTLFCGQGELFRVPELSRRTDEYLGYVKNAGKEYAEGGITTDTRNELNRLLYPKDVFEKMADASWGIDKESGEKEDDSLVFTRQMAALYQKEAYPGKDLVVEMYYTDLDKCYQMILEKEGSRVITEDLKPYTTRIETPYSVWHDISVGKIRGDEALMQQMYKVKGDFNLMMNWDEYFGGAGTAEKQEESGAKEDAKGSSGIHMPTKGTTMNILLIPWIVFWVAAAIDGYIGGLISIASVALVSLLSYRNKKTIYDVLTGVLVTAFSIVSILGADGQVVLPLSYLSFGMMWTISCFCKIPLTAHYSMNDYNGETALTNPLFVKTNRILTLMWGILYLLTPIWTYIIMGTKISSLTGAINSILPILMGIFTAWFQRWYPARVARGK